MMLRTSSVHGFVFATLVSFVLIAGCGGGQDSPSDAEIPPPPQRTDVQQLQSSGDVPDDK